MEGTLRGVWCNPRPQHVALRYRLKPDRLPDPGRARVEAAVVLRPIRLLPARLRTLLRIARTHDDRDLGRRRDHPEVGGEGRPAAPVAYPLDTVDPHRRVVI